MNEREIFTAATQIEDARLRSTFLDTVCQGDLLRRHRIESLLRAEAAAGSIIDRPGRLIDRLAGEAAAGEYSEVDPIKVSGLESSSPGSIQPGTTIGPYQIQQLLGEGGMGVVYVAKQSLPVKRLVALKVLRPGDSSRNVLARFEQERQALAMMDHPGIARILDAGTTADGRPYFAMELVKGIPISDFCDQENLSPKERLELFIPVCAAVQHAHQKGIIHRDLKPSNILIASFDGRPIPKVIDFGVAKAIGFRLAEESVYTEVGSIVGTIEYMAPEQAELNNLDIDTRADVYALGVILYELLTGSPPFSRQQLRSAAFDEMLRIIREVDPPKPSTKISSSNEIANIAACRKLEPRQLTRLLTGDLDWVVMKALAKERQQRYQSVGDLSADVDRFLNMEAVAAGPPGIGYRVRRFLKRNRVGAIATGLVLLAVLGGGVATTWGWLESKKQVGLASAALTNETRALTAEKQASSAARKANTQTLAALRSLTDEVVSRQLARSEKLSPQDQAFLRKIEGFFLELSQSTGDDHVARQIRGEGLQRVAELRMTLGQREDAFQAVTEAAELYQKLGDEFGDHPEYLNEQARCLTHQSSILYATGKHRAAIDLQEKAIKILVALVAEFPEQTAFHLHLARGQLGLAIRLNLEGMNVEAEVHYADGLNSYCNLVEAQPADTKFRSGLAELLSSRGTFFKGLSRYQEAEADFHESVELLQVMATEIPDDLNFQRTRVSVGRSLGEMLCHLGRFQDGEIQLRASVDVGDRLVSEYPLVPEDRNSLGLSRKYLGVAHVKQKEYDQARTQYQAAMKLFEKLVADYPNLPQYRLELSGILNSLGVLERELKQWDAAEVYYVRALELKRQLAAENWTFAYRNSLAIGIHNLGNIYLLQKKHASADEKMREALEVREKLIVEFPGNPMLQVEYGGSCCNYANAMKQTGKFEASLDWYERAIAAIEPVHLADPRAVVARCYLCNSHFGKSQVLAKLNRWADALVDLKWTKELDDGRFGFFRILAENRCRAQIKQTSPEALAELQQLVVSDKLNPGQQFDASCVLAIVMGQLTDAESRDKVAQLIMESLRKIETTGDFFKPAKLEYLQTAEELSALQQRPEYREWLSKIQPKDSSD